GGLEATGAAVAGGAIGRLDPQPAAALGHGQLALKQALAGVLHLQPQLLALAGVELAEHETPRVEIEARADALLHGQVAEEVVQKNVGIGLVIGLAGRLGEVHAANRGEEMSDVTSAKQLAGILPFILAALDEVIEGPAAPSRGEGKLSRQLPR